MLLGSALAPSGRGVLLVIAVLLSRPTGECIRSFFAMLDARGLCFSTAGGRCARGALPFFCVHMLRGAAPRNVVLLWVLVCSCAHTPQYPTTGAGCRCSLVSALRDSLGSPPEEWTPFLVRGSTGGVPLMC